MQTTLSLRWIEALNALEAPWRGSIVIAGEGAHVLAAACMAAGSAPLSAEGDDFVLLANESLDRSPKNWTDLERHTADMVVLRRAWLGRPDLAASVSFAAGLLVPGGRLVVADIDVDRLLGGSTIHYPYRLRFVGDDGAAGRLRSSTVSPGSLAIEVTRAGLERLESFGLDEERAHHDSAEEYWEAVRDGAWPSLSEMTDAEREPFLEQLGGELRRAAPTGGMVDRRPWFAVAGIKR